MYERLAARRAVLDDELESVRRAEADRAEREAAATRAKSASNGAQDEKGAAVKEADVRQALFGERDGDAATKSQKSGDAALQDQRQAQDRITEDLLDMARALRQSQQSLGASIAKDNELIERASEALNRNVGKMTATGQRLGQYSKQSTSTTWLSLGAIAVVFAAIFIMIPIIKLT